MCRECGYTVMCKNCNISLTYHSYENKLKCHYCGHEEKLVTTCPECNSDKIRYFGTGTQRLEQEIHKQFPQAKTIRMDVDTVTKKNSHEEILNQFKEECAKDLNINLKQGYNGDLTSKEAGSVGGEMVKRMVATYQNGIK